MAIRPANEMRKISMENIDALYLSNCNKKLLEEIEHEINDSAATCDTNAYVYVKDRASYEDGYSSEEINFVKKYLVESLGYDVKVFYTNESRPKNHWGFLIFW